MGELRDRMHQDLARGDYSASTVRQYTACVQNLVDHFGGRSPLKIGTVELRAFMDHVESEKLSVQRRRQYIAALKFLYARTLGRPDLVAWMVYPHEKRRVPVVLSGTEVERLLAAIKNRICLAVACTLYGAGLRIQEALQLEVRDILSERGLLHIRAGKGGHERYAMLSSRLLTTLRTYWRAERPRPPLLFASRLTTDPIHAETVRMALRSATIEAGIQKHVTPHVLRHSFATHQLELGVDIRIIQQLLGHASIRSTSIYAQVNSDLVKRTPSPFDVLGTPAAKRLG
jgi:site-specific recombinase XerD